MPAEGDDTMMGRTPRDDGNTNPRGDHNQEHEVLRELHAKMAQDMARIEYGLKFLSQQIEAVPGQVAAELTRSGASGWSPSNWFRSQQSHEQTSVPQPHGNIARLVELQAENHSLKIAAQRELEVALRRNMSLESQLRNSQEEVQKLREKEGMFRTIILDQAGVQKVTDEEMVQGFLKLRQDIHKISRSKCYLADTNPSLLKAQKDDRATLGLKTFYSPPTWEKLSVADRRLRMRARIFDELYLSILNCECFGLEGFKKADGPNLEPLGDSIELGLQHFELLLQERGVSDGDISDWRITTLKCVELSGIEEATSALTADDILSIFEPILSKTARLEDKKSLRSSVSELCKDAFRLRMMMRKSKDRYVVETVSMKPETKINISAVESRADPVAVEGGKNSDESDGISYVMFGVLTKHSQAKDQPVRVLEKAQVVLKRK